jgi:uncharacterized membrane protein
MGRAILILGWATLGLGLVLGLVATFASRPATPEGSWATGLSVHTLGVAAGAAMMLVGAGSIIWCRRRRRDTPQSFLRGDDDAQIVEAIRSFEKRTSGEIRVHLATGGKGAILERAAATFERLGMAATAARNGVLFFVDVPAHSFCVIGDEGIDALTPDGFWDDVVVHVRARFQERDFAGGLVEGIRMAGEKLAEHFPLQADDVNELPDEISRDP